jgi:branched-chain amino acid transport system ATP-binding protein
MTVKENLLLGAFFSRGRQKKEQIIKDVYKLYPRLQERQNQVAKTLSGGEAQMLALGRGLMASPDFLAIDEPSLGLAPNLVQSLLETIKRLNDQGLTILIVEQNLSLIEGVIKRIYRLEEGRIV